jgi:hypothetical protein
VLGLFYVLFFLPALVLAGLSLAIARFKILPLPPALKQFWPWRAAFVGALVFVAFIFLLLQLLAGFGLENAATDFSPTALARPAVKGAEPPLNALLMRRTPWLTLAALSHLTALVGALLELWLALRKNRPLPKIDITW